MSPDRAGFRVMAERAISDFTTASHQLAGHLDDLGREMRATPAFLPHPHTPWYEDPLHWGGDVLHDVGSAFSHAWNWTEANAGSLAKSAFDVLGMAGSTGLVALGGIAGGGGLALDATGFGAVVGVPVDALGLAGMAAGAGGVGYFDHELSKDLNFSEARSQASIQSDPGYGARPQPGDGTPAGGNAYNPDVADKVSAVRALPGERPEHHRVRSGWRHRHPRPEAADPRGRRTMTQITHEPVSVAWRPDRPPVEVGTVDGLDSLLDAYDEEARSGGERWLVHLVAGDGQLRLWLGVGAELVPVGIEDDHAGAEVPWSLSAGDLPEGEGTWWADDNTESELSPTSLVPMADAREAARRWLHTRRSPDNVRWM